MDADFTPITTQADLDAAVNAVVGQRYADYDDLKAAAGKNAGYEKTIGEQNAKIKALENSALKARIAHETGLPYEMASRLTGETEKDIRKDAEAMAKFVTKPRVAPLKSTEPNDGDDKTASMRAFLGQLIPND